ncbi:hypothetical protein TYRP_016828 [Tyrophagus putrescentiae]|nr:hypothetical protein TYRP_016828 [Tyrophagus putrescentiae]
MAVRVAQKRRRCSGSALCGGGLRLIETLTVPGPLNCDGHPVQLSQQPLSIDKGKVDDTEKRHSPGVSGAGGVKSGRIMRKNVQLAEGQPLDDLPPKELLAHEGLKVGEQ